MECGEQCVMTCGISYDNNCKFALQDDITEHKLLASPLSKILLNTLGIF